MKKFFIMCALLVSVISIIFSDEDILSENFKENSRWHSWDDLPKEGQLFMCIVVIEDEYIEDEYIEQREQIEINPNWIFISNFNKKQHSTTQKSNGWWEIDKENLWILANGSLSILIGKF